MSEYSRIMLALVTVCGLAAASAVWPVIDVVLTAGLLTFAGGLVAGYLGREVWRELRFRRDMRALDARDAARGARVEVPA